ncbi:unnamed protein product [Coffea canephora]|uniref:Beta-glucosidase n=1 Tax=Coffea canephora TaxID=49390 RepID=A0A068U794_COFCA|nr:unnamed protein product [Coffea canephora]
MYLSLLHIVLESFLLVVVQSLLGNCSNGDSEKEPFIAAHNIILAHAAPVKIYKAKYQKNQGGTIGIIVLTGWFEALSNSTADNDLYRNYIFDSIINLIRFLDPIAFGRYPKEMNDLLGSTLPKFSSNDSDNLKLGVDFIGINHYTSFYVGDCCIPPANPHLEVPGQKVSLDKPTLKMASPLENLQDTITISPTRNGKTVTYISERYNNIPIIITENGELPTLTPLLMNPLNDVKRVEYLRDYLDYLSRAMRKGADVRGYFVWTLPDAYEWLHGFTKRFGPRHVDHTTLKVETHS